MTQPVPRDHVPKTLRCLGGHWVGADNLWVDLPYGPVSPGSTRLKYGTFTLNKHDQLSDVNGRPTLTAHRLDGKGKAKGDRQEKSSYASAAGPHDRVVHFWPTTITLPTQGCWASTEKLGDTTVRFVVDINEAASPAPAELVPALGLQRKASDALPSRLAAQDTDLDPASSRLLGRSQYGKHWVALNNNGDICLVTQLAPGVSGHPGKKGIVSGASCTPPQAFRRDGLTLQVGGKPLHGAVAYLLPTDVDESSVQAAVDRLNGHSGTHAEVIKRGSSPLLVVNSSGVDAADPITITRDDDKPDIVLLSPS